MAIVKRLLRAGAGVALTGAATAISGPAWAQGGPRDWQLNLMPAASPSMERISEFHDLLLVIITLISLFVLGLLLYVMFRFSEKRNPTPSRTTHNTLLEVLWTTIPVIILVVIAVPSFRLLYYTDRVEDAEMTLKAIGHQWYWSYEYPDNGNFTFDSLIVPDEELEPGQPRLLTADTPVVLPVDTKIRLLITAADVLHSFALPAFGIKLDAVPGRTNETWVEITREGTYYGQCSEICGTGHAYMPIMVKAVSKEAFADWVAEAQQRFARVDGSARPESPDAPERLAQAPDTN
ncbi:MAG TPA: cytochrome c oxidase subunit II [Kiloniellales bacterium]|nr:cytochrome c oxidase subunit II [Kiloniellales bacterium]